MAARTYKQALDAYNELLEARDNAKKKAASDGFDKLSTEERAAITKYDNEHTDLLEEIRALRPDTANLNVNVGVAGNRDLSENDKKDLSGFRLTRAFALLADNKKLDGVEAEIDTEGRSQADRKKNLIEGNFVLPDFREMRGQTVTGQTTNAGDQGGNLVSNDLQNGLIDQFWSQGVMKKLNVTRFTNLQGNPIFPTLDTKLTVQERTEIEALDDTEVLFGQISMSPKRRGISVPYSKQTLLQVSMDVEAELRRLFLKAFNAKADTEMLSLLLGAITSGNGNLLAASANANLGAVPTYANVVGLESLVAASDADMGSLGYLTNSKVRGKLKLTQKFDGTNGMPVWEDGNNLNGYPSVVSNYVPSNIAKGTSGAVNSALIFGNFQDVYVGQWGTIDFLVNPYSLDKNHQVRITANTYWDMKIARAKSFSGIKDLVTV